MKLQQDNAFLVTPYTGLQGLVLLVLTTAWVFAMLFFYHWWFNANHVVDFWKFGIITFLLIWVTLQAAHFLFLTLRARVPNPYLEIPIGWRVAMVVTKVPSEPIPMVQETIRGMLRQGYPADIWLADEDPDQDMITWCNDHQIKISSRKGVPEYHQNDWPRRMRCKEGNLAYFYDKIGYNFYDFVIQMDADHIPQEGYLEEMIRPFLDPSVGYISAPSICDLNASISWSARARLYAEAHFHGLQQAGSTNGFAPLCIGSHYAVRTRALREIGGLGPELAEDHSTTLMMNAAGWHGVHAISAIARGHGPRNFADFAIQEFQWARSLTTILFEFMPTNWYNLPIKKRLHFAISQLWYPLSSLSMLIFLVIPASALYTSTPWVSVIYLDFLWRIMLMIMPLIMISTYLTKLGYARPRSAKFISLESFYFIFVRWPWSLLGCLMALWDQARSQRANFRITPKPGAAGEIRFSSLYSLPYIIFSFFALAPVIFVTNTGSASGYIYFSLINALIYAIVFTIINLSFSREDLSNAESKIMKFESL